MGEIEFIPQGESVSNVNQRFEQEKRELEEACFAKDAELAAFKKELECRSDQLRAVEEQVSSLGEQVKQLREHKNELEIENNFLKSEILGVEQILNEERVKLRDEIRSS